MPNLEHYKKLNREVKHFAIPFFVAVLEKELGIDKVSDIYDALILRNNNSSSGLPKKNSKFWENKKRTGEPIRWTSILELVDNLVPGVTSCLNNPLWRVLSLNNPNKDDIKAIIESLEPLLGSKLIITNRTTSISTLKKLKASKQINAIARRNTIDALACLLLLLELCEIDEEFEFYQKIENAAYALFFRLSTFTPFDLTVFPIYQMIHNRYFSRQELLLSKFHNQKLAYIFTKNGVQYSRYPISYVPSHYLEPDKYLIETYMVFIKHFQITMVENNFVKNNEEEILKLLYFAGGM